MLKSFSNVKTEILANVNMFMGKLKGLYHILLNCINEYIDEAMSLDACCDALISAAEDELQQKYENREPGIKEADIHWDNNMPIKERMRTPIARLASKAMKRDDFVVHYGIVKVCVLIVMKDCVL